MGFYYPNLTSAYIYNKERKRALEVFRESLPAYSKDNSKDVSGGDKKNKFESYLLRRDDPFMKKLHSLLDNHKSGKEVAKILEALEDYNYLPKMSRYVNDAILFFGIECKNQSINSYFRKNKFSEAEKKQIIDELIK